jgi:hypothetical protein
VLSPVVLCPFGEACFLRFAVTLLKRHPVKDSIRSMMLRSMMNADFLTQVLTRQHD